MKVYFLAYGPDRLLCESEPSSDPDEKRRIIGAFLPGKEGNYYRQVLLGFTGPGQRQYTPSFVEWWEWLRGSIAAGDTLMDEEFPFEPEDVHVIHAELDLVAPERTDYRKPCDCGVCQECNWARRHE